MRRFTWIYGVLSLIYGIAVFVRLLPAVQFGYPYAYDVWEDIGRVASILTYGHPKMTLPHGPLFYFLLSGVCLIFGADLLTAFTYFIPFTTSLVIVTIFLLTKRFTGDSRAGLYAALISATGGIFAHWTGLCVPEALGLVFAAYVIYLLFIVMDRGGLREGFLLLIFLTVTLLTHHMTTFLLLLSIIVLSLVIIFSRPKGFNLWVPVILSIVFILTAFAWWEFSVSPWTIAVMRLIIEAASNMIWVGVILAAIPVVFTLGIVLKWKPILPHHEAVAGAVMTLTFTICLSIIIFILAALTPYSFPLIYVAYYIIPFVVVDFFPALVGLLTILNRTEALWKRMFAMAWVAAPVASVFFLTSASYWFVLSYRHVSFILLGGFPLVGLGYLRLSQLGHYRWRPIQGIVFAYMAILLVFSAFPSPEYAFGHEEAYYRPELSAANWAGGHFLKGNSIDSDHRMGVLLRYTTGQFVWLGNASSWVGNVSQTGVVSPVGSSLQYLVITDSMVHYSVTDGVEQEGKPLPASALHFLDSTSSINRIYSSAIVAIYQNRHYLLSDSILCNYLS
ncbi:MAG: glycosyltransferase family 39 protein [Candidatus Bathyarchaeia archaeon]